jgi:dihydroxy-acid dehydratase
MPEVGNFPIPGKLLSRGVRDMIRISDARMSGTAFGTIILHVAPESAIGGPLALVEDGDEIELDVPARSIVLHVSEPVLELRRARWHPPTAKFERGYGRMYIDHVLQAPQGCDFDFLVGATPVAASEQPKF